MKKWKWAAFVAVSVLAMAISAAALAAPMVSNAQYTAYLGENNHLFIQNNITKELKTLQTSIDDILSISDEGSLYCLAKGGVLYQVKLDGTGSNVVSRAPSQQDLEQYTQKTSYTLTNGALSMISNGAVYQITTAFAITAAQYGDKLFYCELGSQGAVIKSISLSAPVSGIATIGPAYITPASLCASETVLVAIGQDGSAMAYRLLDAAAIRVDMPFIGVKAIGLTGDSLLCYGLDEATGYPVYLGKTQIAFAPTVTPIPVVTAAPAAAPTATPVANAYYNPASTKAPTVTKKPAATAAPGYAAVKYGQKGTKVYNMQKRLQYLGYPVGSADSEFGDNTLHALKLFQGQAGYTESATATSALLEKLYSKTAPEFDLFISRKAGNVGERVRMLQNRLWELGYYQVGMADGSYGQNTAKAVKQFQEMAGLKATGTADRDTMRILYSDNAPENKKEQRPPKETDKPPRKPDEQKTPGNEPPPVQEEDSSGDVVEIEDSVQETKNDGENE